MQPPVFDGTLARERSLERALIDLWLADGDADAKSRLCYEFLSVCTS